MRTYLTVLTTDDYAVGAVALWLSLRRTQPKYPFLVVLTKLVSAECEAAIQRLGIETLRIDAHLQKSPAESGERQRHWDNTFSKLLVFDLVQYEKIVYLDSDLMVLRNLDHLFERPHMSAAVPDKLMPGREGWVQFCSGLMVLEPQAGLAAAIMRHVPEVERRMTSFSDQDLLHEHFPDWPSHQELELGQGYGVFPESLDRYVKEFGFSLDQAAPEEKMIAAIHFVGSRKPWAWRPPERALRVMQHRLAGRSLAVRILREYLALLREAEKMLGSGQY